MTLFQPAERFDLTVFFINEAVNKNFLSLGGKIDSQPFFFEMSTMFFVVSQKPSSRPRTCWRGIVEACHTLFCFYYD